MATMYTPEEMNNVMSWDSEIENDGQDFEPLPEGDYIYQVTNFQKGWHNDSEKVPACPKAELTLTVYSEDGKRSVQVNENILLYKTLEWKLSQFFRSIGQKKRGEAFKPNWNAVIGSRGVAHVILNEYTGNDGKLHKNNRIGKFLDADSASAPVNNSGFQAIPNGTEEEIPFN